MFSPLPELVPHPLDCLNRIRSPNRISRWLEGTGEFNVPDSPPSGSQRVMDDEEDLRSPPLRSHLETAHDNASAARSNQEGAQTGAGLFGIDQQANRETLNALQHQPQAYYQTLSAQVEQRNEVLLRHMNGYAPIPNSGGNTMQNIRYGNGPTEWPSNPTAPQNGKMNTSPTP
ncbi:hypothetical protein EAE96_010636 [Botrytis aclada]|nr:hypothetical protein EAE96_010636 [Botrytis aclada]